MWTRRRIFGVGLSLLALSGIPRRSEAQVKKPNVPNCPEKNGDIGSWKWRATRTGWEAKAQKWKLVDRGILTGNSIGSDSALSFGEPLAVLGGTPKTSILLAFSVSRQPTAKEVDVTVRAGPVIYKDRIDSQRFRQEDGVTGPWTGVYLVNGTLANFDQNAIINSSEITFEFFDANTVLCKLSVQTGGFKEATKAAETEYKSLDLLWKAVRCADNPAAGLPCYLTTLCVEILELPDNCFELRTLRNYRDKVLLKTPNGTKVIEEYYQRAPALVSAIKESGDQSWFLRFYVSHLLPCVIFAKLRLHSLWLWRHSDMMRKLERRYSI